MNSPEMKVAVDERAVAELARVAELEGITVPELARLVLENFAASQEPPSFSVPGPVDWRRTPRRAGSPSSGDRPGGYTSSSASPSGSVMFSASFFAARGARLNKPGGAVVGRLRAAAAPPGSPCFLSTGCPKSDAWTALYRMKRGVASGR